MGWTDGNTSILFTLLWSGNCDLIIDTLSNSCLAKVKWKEEEGTVSFNIALKFERCINVMNISWTRCILSTKLYTFILFLKKNNHYDSNILSYFFDVVKNHKKWQIFSLFFEEENVSATVEHNDINIFYVISHNKVIQYISFHRVSKTTKYFGDFSFVLRKLREKALFLTSQLRLWKFN